MKILRCAYLALREMCVWIFVCMLLCLLAPFALYEWCEKTFDNTTPEEKWRQDQDGI